MTLVPQPGGSLAVGIDRTPTGCNPNTVAGDTWANEFVLQAVLPGASAVSSDGESVGNQPVVQQAELVSTTPQTVVYTLDPKAVWSDGVPISASDFVYAWQEQRGNSGASVSALGYRDIQSVTGSNGGKTVTVIFKTPFADWQMLFAFLMPAHVLQKVGWDPHCTTVDPAIDLSGGPYMIQSVVPGHSVQLVANPRWWGTPVFVRRVDIRTASSPSQLALWQRHGAVQVVEPASFSPSFLQTLDADPHVTSEVDVSSTFLQLEFSTTAPATTSSSVRQAIAHAVNRQALVNTVVGWADANIVPSASHLFTQTQSGYPNTPTNNNGTNPLVEANSPTTTTVPPGMPGSFPTTDDPVTTARLLTSDGYLQGPSGRWLAPDGSPFTLRLGVDTGDGWSAAAGTLLARQLEHAGFNVQVTTYPSTTAAGMALSSGTIDMALIALDATPYPSQAVAWYSMSLGPPGQNGSQDWSNYDNPAFDTLLQKGSRELNPVTGLPDYTQADQMLWTDMVALPLFAEPTATAWSSTLWNVQANTQGPGLLWGLPTWEHRITQATGS